MGLSLHFKLQFSICDRSQRDETGSPFARRCRNSSIRASSCTSYRLCDRSDCWQMLARAPLATASWVRIEAASRSQRVTFLRMACCWCFGNF